MAFIGGPNTWDIEAGGSPVLDQPGQLSGIPSLKRHKEGLEKCSVVKRLATLPGDLKLVPSTHTPTPGAQARNLGKRLWRCFVC